MSADQRQRLTAPQLPGRRLGDHPWLEHHYVAWPDVDLCHYLVGHLLLDPTNLSGVSPTVGLHRDNERLARMTRIQAHRYGAAGADPADTRCGTFDAGRVGGA